MNEADLVDRQFVSNERDLPDRYLASSRKSINQACIRSLLEMERYDKSFKRKPTIREDRSQQKEEECEEAEEYESNDEAAADTDADDSNQINHFRKEPPWQDINNNKLERISSLKALRFDTFPTVQTDNLIKRSKNSVSFFRLINEFFN